MATPPSPQAAGSSARAAELVRQLRVQRDEMLTELTRIADEQCRASAEWGGTSRTVNFVLRAFASHEMDHLQHVQKLLRGRGHQMTEAKLLLTRAQALRGETEALLLSLSDEEIDATGPAEGDWPVSRLAEHLVDVDRTYLQSIRQGIAAAAAG